MPQLQHVLKGERHTMADRLGGTYLPITQEILEQWKRNPSRRDAPMLWAASTLCFFGSCEWERQWHHRMWALTPITTSHTGLCGSTAPQTQCGWKSLYSVLSATSLVGGWHCQLHWSIGATQKAMCPLMTMLGYLAQQGSRSGSLFKFEDGQPLTRDHFVAVLQSALETCGIDPTAYARHSFLVEAAKNHSCFLRSTGLSHKSSRLVGQLCIQLFICTTKSHSILSSQLVGIIILPPAILQLCCCIYHQGL